MSAVFLKRRYKDKNNLAINAHCELLFFKRTSFFLKSATAATVLFHISMCFFCFTSAKIWKENEKWKKRDDHFFHFTYF